MKIKNLMLMFLVLSVLIMGCTNHYELKSNQVIKKDECEQISITKKNEYREFEESFCITTIKRIENLIHKESLAYVGSDESFHFFYWFTKRSYYENQPTGFAVVRSEFTPKDEFDVTEDEIGEFLFGN